jgi:ATP adenylyltransferase
MLQSDIITHVNEWSRASRFETLLRRDSRARPLYDQILFETEKCVVAPTLGSILPYWLLVIPRTPFTNFANWRAETRIDPFDVVSKVQEALRVTSDRTIWFEHGPATSGSAIGCGVDHAHLHVILDAPFSFDEFAHAAVNAIDLDWRPGASKMVYRTIGSRRSYLIAASGDKSVYAQQVERAGSQFFRRLIAELVGLPEMWDYKTHMHIENVRRTLDTFGQCVARGEQRQSCGLRQ